MNKEKRKTELDNGFKELKEEYPMLSEREILDMISEWDKI